MTKEQEKWCKDNEAAIIRAAREVCLLTRPGISEAPCMSCLRKMKEFVVAAAFH